MPEVVAEALEALEGSGEEDRKWEERRGKMGREKREERKLEERREKMGREKIEEYNKNHFTSRCLRLSKAAWKKIENGKREEGKWEERREERENLKREERKWIYFNCLFFGL